MDIYELHKILSTYFGCEVSQTHGFSNVRLLGSIPPKEIILDEWFVYHLGSFNEQQIITLLTALVENDEWYINPNDAPAARDIQILYLDEHKVNKYLIQ